MCHLCVATPVLFGKHLRRQCPLLAADLPLRWKPLRWFCLVKVLSMKPMFVETSVLNIFEYESLWRHGTSTPLMPLICKLYERKASILSMATCTVKSNECVPSICIESLVAQLKTSIWNPLLHILVIWICKVICKIRYMRYMATTRAGSLLHTVCIQYLLRWGQCDDTLVCAVSFLFDALHNVVLDSGPDYPPAEKIFCCISPEILKTGSWR